ncbi:MAG: transporter related protein [Bacteroidetes bacterium]|nr:transporter related protein [Bacteroidota bacterium]
MNKFLQILIRFIPPYKKYVVGSIGSNLLSAMFTLFSFGAIIPILQILFGIESATYTYKDWNFSNSWGEIGAAVKNNLFWYISDTIHQQGAITTLAFLGIFLIIATMLKTGFSFLASYYTVPIRTGVLRDLRRDIFSKILNLPISFFSEERKGDIMSRMTGDVGEIENSVISSLDMIFKNPILILVYVGTLFWISWELTFFVMILLPISAYLIGTVGKKLKARSLIGQQQSGQLLSQIEETLGGLRIIKAFNAEDKVKARFAQINEALRRTNLRINTRYLLAHPMSESLGTVVIAILLWFGGMLILTHHSSITAPTFIYYLVVFYSIINPSKDLSKAVYSIQKGLASLERVDKILKAENTMKEPDVPKKLGTFGDKIEYRNVWFKYKNDWVLQDINVTVEKGKTVALVGQSGSGKSTFVDLLPRFYDVVKGEIVIDGINIKEIGLQDLRALMGNVNQEAILFNDTFFNNISFGVENATMEQVIEAARIANAHDFIMATEMGYDTNIGDRGGKLSGGQRQRVSIARAILKNPPILILDEATSALDTESERLVQDAIENLMKNRTSIVIAHRLSTIKRADEICVMHEGRIVERGKHDELIALDGYYKRLCDMQSF